MEKNKELTPMMELIEQLETIKEKDCNTFTEVVFFDGIISLINAKFLPKEKQVTDELVSLLMQTTEYEVLQSFRDKVNKYNNQ